MTDPAFIDLTSHWVGIVSAVIFVLAYLLVMSEEFTHLRKSKPVLLGAGLIWTLLAVVYLGRGDATTITSRLGQVLAEYIELFLFLLTAMTYVNAMRDRQIFNALRSWLIRRRMSLRAVFWITGVISFFISPVIDNMTTALVLSAVILAVGQGNRRFIAPACLNVVVAANAGGAFSPFGDITTLLVWQKGMLGFFQFFELFIPAVINFLVPAAVMHFVIPKGIPEAEDKPVSLAPGARRTLALFALTLCMAVVAHALLEIPPVIGMLTGLGLLQFLDAWLARRSAPTGHDEVPLTTVPQQVARVEWDTLLFFFGVIFCVEGLGMIGYLSHISVWLYGQWGATAANIAVGALSAIVDNIPIMVAVLEMGQKMDLGQWLLVTFTTGVGGSMLSIGSAAGVALMGQARGYYTFFYHLRWAPVVALGYVLAIAAHWYLNMH